MVENLEFAIGKEIAKGRIGIVRECDTEDGIRELYRELLIQSGSGSGYLPYKRRNEDGKYILLRTLANEVEEELREQIERNQSTENPHRYIM